MRRRGRLLAALGSGAVLVTGLAGCGGDASVASSGGVDVSHVHGLAPDPDDPDRLFVATHEGLAAYTDADGLSKVGDLGSDFMGFTVAPGGVLYASGHPGEGEDAPSALGLIASEDGGRTWDDVSLSGEADFHAMDAGVDGVYGFDATRGVLRTSADGREWTDMPTDAGFIDLAVDPTSGRLLGTTGEGRLVSSTDDGRTFELVEGAPPLVLVDVSPEGAVVGIDPDGRLHGDTSGRWELRGGVADSGLQAFSTGPDGAVWLLDGQGLRRSTDGGASFQRVPAW